MQTLSMVAVAVKGTVYVPSVPTVDGGRITYDPVPALSASDVDTALRTVGYAESAFWSAVLSIAHDPDTLKTLTTLALSESLPKKAASKVSGELARIVQARAEKACGTQYRLPAASTVKQYASTVGQVFGQHKQGQLIVGFNPDGTPSGFVARQHAVIIAKGEKLPESASAAVARMFKQLATHAGANVRGAAPVDDVRGVLMLISSIVGDDEAFTLLEQAQAELSAMQRRNEEARANAEAEIQRQHDKAKAIIEASAQA